MEHRIDRNINRLVSIELKESKQYYEETFNSVHEGYAIIAEEFEEAEHELRKVRDTVEALWDDIKEDRIDYDFVVNVSKMEIYGKRLASEAIQVSAMARKLIESVEMLYEDCD